MVNTGKPSDACLKCKDRRVKCDSTKPECNRCQRLGVKCPGYPERAGISFRDETSFTQDRAQRMYSNLRRVRDERPRSDSPSTGMQLELRQSRWLSSATAEQRRTAILSGFGTSVPASFGQPFDASSAAFFREPLVIGSVSKFIEQWNSDGTAIVSGTVTMASNMYPECNPALRATLETLALWTLSIVETSAGRQKVREAAFQVYGVALGQINQAIDTVALSEQNPTGGPYSEGDLDQIMLAVEMLTIFEILAQLEDFETRVSAHWSGMCQLILRKGPNMFRTELGRRIFLDYFIGILINRSVLPQPESFPLPSDTPEVLLNSPFTPKLPEYTILPILQRSFDVKVAAGQFLMGSPASSPIDLSTVQTLKAESQATIEHLAEWYVRAPDFRKKDDRPRNDSKFGFVALIWNLSRVHQILQYDIQVRCNQRLLQEPDADKDLLLKETHDAVLEVRQIVKNMKATMPYQFSADDPFLSGLRSSTAKEIYGHMGYFHPLLIISMTYCISDEEHVGVQYARQASANMVGLTKPVRSFPRWLVPVPYSSVPDASPALEATEEHLADDNEKEPQVEEVEEMDSESS